MFFLQRQKMRALVPIKKAHDFFGREDGLGSARSIGGCKEVRPHLERLIGVVGEAYSQEDNTLVDNAGGGHRKRAGENRDRFIAGRRHTRFLPSGQITHRSEARPSGI